MPWPSKVRSVRLDRLCWMKAESYDRISHLETLNRSD